MAERVLSIFIDESGDFGSFNIHTPFYLVTLVFHDQSINIVNNIDSLEEHLKRIGYPSHAIHIGPLIRRESVYQNDLMEDRKRLFNVLFNFARKLDFYYTYTLIKKSECNGILSMVDKQANFCLSFYVF